MSKQLRIVDWWVRLNRFVETLCLALFVEEGILVCLVDKEVKLEITPRELHIPRDGCPLAKGDRFAVGSTICQCIAADDILPQHIA